MAYPSSQLDAEKNPQTRCSNCQTVFEVSRELLSSSDTRVRCGECLSIFDALEEIQALDDAGAAADKQAVKPEQDTQAASTLATNNDASLAGLGQNPEALDVTYSDFDLFSEDADLPEIAYFDQTRDTPDFDFDAVDMGVDETFNDTLFVHDVTIDADATTIRPKAETSPGNLEAPYAEIDFVADEQPREPLIFKYRDSEAPDETESPAVAAQTVVQNDPAPVAQVAEEQRQEEKEVRANLPTAVADKPLQATGTPHELEQAKRRSPWLFRLGMLALLVVLLGGLFAYRTRPQLYNNPTIRPVLAMGCKVLGCSLPARVALEQLQMVKRNVYSHPSIQNALVVNVSFRNTADFDQRMPSLHMVLSNRVGRTVAKRDFAPPDYMSNWPEKDTIKSNEQLDFTLEVTDPGQDAQSFEFYFREHQP